MRTFPEINNASLRDCKESLKLAILNFDSVKAEYQPELKERMEALRDRIRRLKATEARIARIKR